ncbi:Arc family DNA-binding protein [Comamonas sp. J-3]|uniref:Arc family DNA-binding protein n=1 Tax=Comamonas trifloxystrobinivorans TaxID=3350256 RepID=UPI00372A2301
MTQSSAQVKIRLPETLKVWLKQEASKSRRSLNSEVVLRLEQSRAIEGADQRKDAA